MGRERAILRASWDVELQLLLSVPGSEKKQLGKKSAAISEAERAAVVERAREVVDSLMCFASAVICLNSPAHREYEPAGGSGFIAALTADFNPSHGKASLYLGPCSA